MARLIFAISLIAFTFPLRELAACGPASIESSYLFVPGNPGEEICGPGKDTWDSDYNYSYSHAVSSSTPGTCFDQPQENVLAWVRYAGSGVTAADVEKVLYAQTQKPNSATNSFGKFLAKSAPASREALGYIQFALKVEAYGGMIREDANDWSDGSQKKADPRAAQTMLDAAVKARAAATNEEIKQRYSYQIMKLRFYTGDFAGSIKEFDSSGLAHSIAPVQMRAKRYLAGAFARTGRKEQAAALLGEILVKSTELSDSVYSDFRYILPLDEAKAKAEAKEPAARAGVQMLFGWLNPSYSIDHIRNSAKDGLARPLVLRMFLREVALFEENNASTLLGHSHQTSHNVRRVTRMERFYGSMLGYATRVLSGWIPGQAPVEPGLPAAEKKHAIALADLAASMRSGAPPNEQNVWAFYGAYMRYMGGQSAQALTEAAKLKSVPYWKDKAQVLELLAKIDLASKLDATLEKEIGAVRPILFKGTEQRLAPLRDFLLLQLEKKYAASGEGQRALAARAARLALSRGTDLDTFGDEKSLPLLITFLEKKDKSPYEKLLEAFIHVKAEDARDRLGSLYLQNGRYADAELEFSKLSAAYLASLDKSYAGGMDPFDIQHADGTGNGKWDKKKVAAELVRLEQKAKQNDPAALLRLGSAQYNMSLLGRHWILTRTYKSWYDRYPHDLRMLKQSLVHLDKAAGLAKDRETQARIAYQKVLVQKGLVDLESSPSEEQEVVDGRKKKLFAALDAFQGTQFYDRYISSCSDYANASKQR